MELEEDINFANKYYLNNDIAVIHKKPIPIQIVEVNYPSRSSAMITKAFYKTPSTTDYNGLWNGKYIDFDKLAANDGLLTEDWYRWFKKYDLSKPMAVIHFTSFRY